MTVTIASVKTKAPKIDKDPRTGEARCQHRDCWGNVCPECFASAAFIMESFGQFYHMQGMEPMDENYAEDIAKGNYRISGGTPELQVVALADLQVGDRIYAYTSTSRPIVVADIVDLPKGRGVTDTKGGRNLFTDARLVVAR